MLCQVFSNPVSWMQESERIDYYVNKAKKLELHKNPFWLKLLHYKKSMWDGFESDIDGGYFFLAKDGKTNTESELNATIHALLSEKSVYKELFPEDSIDFHPLVKFPVRKHFLQKELGIKEEEFPNVDRDRFLRWYGKLRPESISLIFASSYMNNPASMMGHTFLRINSKGNVGHKQILNYGINYAANPGNIGGILYTVYGIFGGFLGNYSLLPYYVSLQSYSNIESRDIWEYKLKLTQEQVDLLVGHAWELGSIGMKYYFFTENCSYNILTLLEIVEPELDLTSRFTTSVIPVETVKEIFDKDLIDSLYWRPSILTKFHAAVNALSPIQKDLMDNMLFDDQMPNAETQDSVDFVRASDVALEYIQNRKSKTKGEKQKYWSTRQREILLKRKDYKYKKKKVDVHQVVEHHSPHLGHAPGRLGMSMGMRHHQAFTNLQFRYSYHDMNASSLGFLNGSQIEVLKFNFRYIPHVEEKWGNRTTKNRFYFHSARLFNLQSVSSYNKYMSFPSWRGDVQIDRSEVGSCKDCISTFGEGGFGLAHELDFMDYILPYGFAQLRIRGHSFAWSKSNFGPGVYGGVLLSFHPRFSLHLNGAYYYPVVGAKWREYKVFGEFRFTTTSNTDLRVYLQNSNGIGEASFNGYLYF